MENRWWRVAVARAGVVVVLTANLVLEVACGDVDYCYPGECDACVGETCTQVCEDPDDEDVGYSCTMICEDGADCVASCSGVDCNVSCLGSHCTSDADGWDGANCTRGAECVVERVGDIYCAGSICDLGAAMNVVCVEGSTCAVAHGELYQEQTIRRMTCDAASSCHLSVQPRQGGGVLCCNGSTDCALDCDGYSVVACENGATVCGVPCETPVYGGGTRPVECPTFGNAIDSY